MPSDATAPVVRGDAPRCTLSSALPYVALVVCQLIWGVSGVFAKHLLSATSMFVVLSSRCLVGTAVLCATVALQPAQRTVALRVWRDGRRDGTWRQLALVGLANQCGNQLLYQVALRYTSATDGALLQPAAPIVTMIFAFALKREPRSVRKVVGVLVCVAGSMCVVAAETFLAPSSATGADVPAGARAFGIVLFLVSNGCIGLYVLLQRPLLERLPAPVVTAGSFVFGSVPILIGLCVTWARGDVDWSHLQSVDWIGLLYTVTMGTSVVYALYSWVNARVGSTITSMGSALAPLTGSLLGVLLLGESLTWLHGLGGALLIAGLLVAVRERHKELALEALQQHADAEAAQAAAAAAAQTSAAVEIAHVDVSISAASGQAASDVRPTEIESAPK